VLSKTRAGSIVLLHDSGLEVAKTAKALPTILKNLDDRGYRFLPLSVLLHSPVAESYPS
jgi:peptidoglycan/xylan/chitin deacetylase (PgdA/CDA1 family)